MLAENAEVISRALALTLAAQLPADQHLVSGEARPDPVRAARGAMGRCAARMDR